MAKKKNTSKDQLNEYVEVDGKIASNNPTALEQIWGADGLSKYGTMDLEVYEARLADMMPVDIQNHARDIGLRPDVDIDLLKRRLIDEFQRHVASFKSSQVKLNYSGTLNKVPKKVLQTLRQGA